MFIGECYIHGLMSCEAIDMRDEGTVESEEFVIAQLITEYCQRTLQQHGKSISGFVFKNDPTLVQQVHAFSFFSISRSCLASSTNVSSLLLNVVPSTFSALALLQVY
jgi:hypothetical protein